MSLTANATPAEIEAELNATAAYDLDGDLALCRRFIIAARYVLNTRPNFWSRDGIQTSWTPDVLRKREQQALAWYNANGGNVSGARTVRADFRGFRE
jgi:uncharacterized membrane protein